MRPQPDNWEVRAGFVEGGQLLPSLLNAASATFSA
jgi:hypothetical protein